MQPTETLFENKTYLSIYNQEFYYLLGFISSKYLIYFKYPFSAEMNQGSATPSILTIKVSLTGLAPSHPLCVVFYCSFHKQELLDLLVISLFHALPSEKSIEIESHHLIVEQRLFYFCHFLTNILKL